MVWGIEFKDYLNRGIIDRLDSDKEDVETYIKSLEFELVALAASSPHEIKDDAGNEWEWVEYISMKIKKMLEELQEQYVLLHKINICLENKNEIIIE